MVVLLGGAELSLSNPAVDLIVHKVFPVLILVDWLVEPPETDLRMLDVPLWLGPSSLEDALAEIAVARKLP